MAAPAPKNTTDLSPEIRNFTNGPALLAQTAPFYVVALITVLLRCYTRAVITKSFGKDDWTILAALTTATIVFVCYAMEISLGVGRYVAVIQANEEKYRSVLQIRQIHMVSVVVGISLVKISVCFFLLRLASRRRYIWSLWALVAFLVVFFLACAGTIIFQCLPVAAAWDMRLRPPPIGTGTATCFTGETFHNLGIFNGVVNIGTDFLLALAPVPLIWKLHMPLRTRISLIIVLSLGIFAAIGGIVRQFATAEWLSPEPWIKDTYAVWNFIELYMGTIAASLPSIKPMFNRFFGTVAKDPGFGHDRATRRHIRPDDTDGFVMQWSKPSTNVKISSNPSEQNDWSLERGNNSEESILPHEREEKMVGIRVVSRVQIGSSGS